MYKGITEWSVKWARHGWQVRGRETGHRDLWQELWDLRQAAALQVQLIWTPSHVNVKGNDEADALAEEGRGQHPHNKRRHQQEPAWVALGLSFMRLAVSLSSASSTGGHPSIPSGSSSPEDSWTSSGEGSSLGGEWSESGFSTDVSDRQRFRKRQMRVWAS